MTTAGIDYAQARAMPWPQALALRKAVHRHRAQRQIEHAVSCRAAALPDRAWDKWLSTLEKDPHA